MGPLYLIVFIKQNILQQFVDLHLSQYGYFAKKTLKCTIKSKPQFVIFKKCILYVLNDTLTIYPKKCPKLNITKEPPSFSTLC